MKLRQELIAGGGTTTGFKIPDDVVAQLGKSRKPAVTVTVNGHTWRTSIAFMSGAFWLGVSAANRAAAGVAGGEVVEFEVELDTEPREIVTPDDLAAALAAQPGAAERYDALSYSKKRAIVEPLEASKAPETRARRIAKVLEQLASTSRT